MFCAQKGESRREGAVLFNRFQTEAHPLRWNFESENRLCTGILLGSEQDSATGFVSRIERFYGYLTREFLTPPLTITAFRQEMHQLLQPLACRVSAIGAMITWILQHYLD
jgi:hypothetical protein